MHMHKVYAVRLAEKGKTWHMFLHLAMWINDNLFLHWFKFFLVSIPLTQPVLLIMDRHGTHTSIHLIQLVRSSDVHLLCLPSHTTRILQPLDVSAFKSFKA